MLIAHTKEGCRERLSLNLDPEECAFLRMFLQLAAASPNMPGGQAVKHQMDDLQSAVDYTVAKASTIGLLPGGQDDPDDPLDQLEARF